MRVEVGTEDVGREVGPDLLDALSVRVVFCTATDFAPLRPGSSTFFCRVWADVGHILARNGIIWIGAGGWALSTSVWRQCNVLEGRRLWAMIPCAAPRGRPKHEWGPATTRAAWKKARQHGFPSLWERRCKQVYCWAGHWARAASDNPAAAVDQIWADSLEPNLGRGSICDA